MKNYIFAIITLYLNIKKPLFLKIRVSLKLVVRSGLGKQLLRVRFSQVNFINLRKFMNN